MKNIRIFAVLLALIFALPTSAQDFGYAKEKAFFKAHWNEVVKDLGGDVFWHGAQYVLADVNNDGTAELYLWFSNREEYLYAMKDNKAVRVSETNRHESEQYSIERFFAPFMAPYELLIDKPIEKGINTEQHLYDRFDIPGIWFRLDPEVNGNFNIKTAIEALWCFDSEYLSDAMYSLVNGSKDDENIKEFVLDVSNGYAAIEYNTLGKNRVEFCYWNMTDGKKLLAMNYYIYGSDEEKDDPMNWFQQILFMKYDPKTKSLEPVVAPIQGYDFKKECTLSLPRKGKNITLVGADNEELVWTGSGFKL